MSTEVVPVDLDTGELLAAPMAVERMTPDDARAAAQWVRDMMHAALTEGTDYGVIPGTSGKPTLFKSGAEMLLLAAGLSFTQNLLRDNDYDERRGVTYRCTVHGRGNPHDVRAVCDAYAGYDERQWAKGQWRAPWNTLIKMAQKRALVGAALNATASSGLFVADAEDTDDNKQPSSGITAGGQPMTDAAAEPPCNDDAADPRGETVSSELDKRVAALTPAQRLELDKHVGDMRWPWPPTSGAVIKAAHNYLDKLEAAR